MAQRKQLGNVAHALVPALLIEAMLAVLGMQAGFLGRCSTHFGTGVVILLKLLEAGAAGTVREAGDRPEGHRRVWQPAGEKRQTREAGSSCH